MSIHPSKIPLLMREEASDFFVDFQEGDADSETRQRFDAWLRRSPEHVLAYLRIASLWEHVGGLASDRAWSADELISLARGSANVVPLAVPAGGPFAAKQVRRAPWMLGIAAGAAACLIGAALYWNVNIRDTYATEIGEQHIFTLSDGSTIALDSRSKVRWRYDSTGRRITLIRGQALFTAAKDPNRPFTVESQGTLVRAVGTQFDVKQRAGGTTVTVIEGKVAVTSSARKAVSNDASASAPRQKARVATPNSPSDERPGATSSVPVVLVSAGEQLTAARVGTEGAVAAISTAIDTSVATAWTRGQLAFANTPLGEVVDEFNRYSERQMVLQSPGLEAVRIGGVFSAVDPRGLIQFLQQLPDITVEEDARAIRISRARR